MSEPEAEVECIEGSEESGDQVTLVMEKLDSLRELRDHQHSLQHTCGQLECCYHEYTECNTLMTQCTAELSNLEGERSRLQERLTQIDHDMNQLTDLKRELEGVCVQCVTMAPTDMYRKMEEKVNEKRRTLGMEQLPVSEAYSQLSSCKHKIGQASKRRKHLAITLNKAAILSKHAVKAGPSFKQCLRCGQLVSRNAVTCSYCQSPCSKPGHSTGKKHQK